MKDRCREFQDLLSAYVDGELPAADAARVEQHVAGCDECTAVVEAYALTDADLAATVPARGETEWEALASRVDRAIEEDSGRSAEVSSTGAADRPPGPAWHAWFHPRTLAFGSGGILVAALLVALFRPWVDGPSPTSLPPSPVPPAPLSKNAAPEKKEGRAVEVLRDEAAAPQAAVEFRAEPEADVSGAVDDLDADATRGAATFDAADDLAMLDADAPVLLEESVVPERETSASLAPAPASPPADLHPSPEPPAGAGSRAEALIWWDSVRPAPDVVGRADERQRMAARAVEPAPAAERDATIKSAAPKESGDRLEAEDPLRAALEWLRAEPRDPAAVDEGLRLLAGDFDGNPVREDAWAMLLARRSAGAPADDADTLHRLASSYEAFRIAYPDRADVLGGRARNAVRWATLEPGACGYARSAVSEWAGAFPGDDAARALEDARRALCGG